MLDRFHLIGYVCVSCCALTGGIAWAADPSDAPPATRPASTRPAQVATQPESEGVVQEAMKHLFTLRRPGAADRSGEVVGSRGGRPTPRAARAAVVGQHPTGATEDDLRYAFPDADLPAASQPAEVIEPVPVAVPGAPYGYALSNPPGSRQRRDFANYRYFDGQPSRYGYGYKGYGADPYGDAYRFGFTRGYDYGRFIDESNIRTQAVLKHYKGHLSEGLTLFNQGRYHEAADAFRLAADTHQGDPAARIYSAHALFAIGRYRDAVPYLKRAFELQPKIAYLRYDFREDYGVPGDFEKQLAALESALAASPDNIDRLVLLGYVRYFTGQRERSFEPLRRAWNLGRRDSLVKLMLDNARPPDVVLEGGAVPARP